MYKRFTSFVTPRPMVLVSLPFILGVVIQSNLNLSLVWLGILLLVSILLVLFHIPGRNSVILFMLVLAGGFRVVLDKQLPANHLSRLTPHPDSLYVVRSVIESIGETRRGTPRYLLKPEQIRGQTISAGKLILYARDQVSTVYPGDTLIATMQINRPRGKRNPNDFDYKAYLKSRDIYFEAFLEDPGQVNVSPHHNTSTALVLLALKNHISNHFHTYLTARSAGILSALILGERGEVEDSIRTDFANTGVIHVLAVSGLHVGYVSVILITIFGLFRMPHHVKMSFVIAGLIFYVALTGGAPSVMRASMMASLIIVGGMLERKSDIFNILATAAVLILLISPAQLQNIGFQLSFLAVLSIVTLFPVLKNGMSKISVLRNNRFEKIIIPIVDLFMVSLAAQLGTLAITIFYFHKIPIVSLFANMVVVPLIGIIVATGMSFLILGMLVPFLAPFWAATIEATIDFMLWFVGHCAELDWAYIATRSIQVFAVIVIFISIFSIALVPFRRVVKIWLILLLLTVNILNWEDYLEPKYLELVVLDVGQGDALLLHTPNGKTMLVDAGLRFGGRDMGRDVIVPYLQFRNWNKLDLVVLTHPHNDHMGGAQYLMEHVPVDQVLMPDIEYESYGYKKLQEILVSRKIPTREVFAGTIDSSLSPLYLRVTAPKWFDGDSQPSNVNNSSIVIQAFYGKSTVLLTGDAEESSEQNQLPFRSLIKSDLIKAPHHGSKTSSTLDYIELVQPDVCLISLGDKNKFRHPSKITLQKYGQLESEIHRTDKEGAIVYRSDGRTWTYLNWRKEQVH